MKGYVSYWVIGLLLLGLGCLGYWQQWQQQQQMHEQIQVLDATLQAANGRAQADAVRVLHDIQQAIQRNQNQPQDMLLLKQTEELFQRADSTIKRLRRLRNDLLRDSRLAAGEATAQNPSEKAADATKQAESVVASFITMVQLLMGSTDARLARLHHFTVDKSHSQCLFYQNQSSSPEALALLTQKEALVRDYELMALAFQTQKIGCGLNIVFDKVGAYAVAESNTVAAGEIYKAELFLASSSGKLASRMAVDGKPITVGPDGRGHVEFRVPRAVGKSPTAPAHWIGTIQTLVNGRDSTFRVLVPYTIGPAHPLN